MPRREYSYGRSVAVSAAQGPPCLGAARPVADVAMDRVSAEATFVVGPFSQIEDVDDGACTLLGYSRSELLSMHGSDLVLSQERPMVAASVNEMRLGALARSPGRLLRKDGSVVSVDVTARPLGEGRVELRVVSTDA